MQLGVNKVYDKRETDTRKRFCSLLGDDDASYAELVEDCLRCTHAGVAFFTETCLREAMEEPSIWAAEGCIVANLRTAWEHDT